MMNNRPSFFQRIALALIGVTALALFFWYRLANAPALENSQHHTPAEARFKAQQTALHDKYFHALGLIRSHRYPDAIKELQEVIAKDPFPNRDAWIAQAHAAKYYGDKELAVRSYLGAVAAEKTGAGIRAIYDLEAAEYLEKMGRSEQAEEIRRQCVDALSSDRFGTPPLATHRNSVTLKAFTIVYAAAVSVTVDGNRDAASALCLKAISMAPDNDWLVLNCAQELIFDGRCEEVLNLEPQLLHSGSSKIVGFAKPIMEDARKRVPIPRHLRVGKPAWLKNVPVPARIP